MDDDSKSWENVTKSLKKIWEDDLKISDGKEFLKYVNDLAKKQKVILESAEKFGTPQYLLDEEALVDRVKLLRETFQRYVDNVRLFYAFKCNDLPKILKVLKEQKVNADVAGLFELELALKLGFDSIIFTSPGKSDEELLLAMKNAHKTIINVDNLDELHRIIWLYEKNYILKGDKSVTDKPNMLLRISFRINVSDESTGVWSKFGVSLDDLRKVSKEIRKYPYISWEGLHFHSSWNDTPKSYVESIIKISVFLKKNFTKGELKGLKFMDIGGGFMCEGSADLFSETTKGGLLQLLYPESEKMLTNVCHNMLPSIGHFAKHIGETFDREIRQKLGLKDLEMWVEPGRFLVSLSTHILVKVCSIKGNALIVDGGISLIGGHDAESTFFPIVNISKPSSRINKSVVYGPLCDPNDLWGYQYFGEKAKIGDVLVVMHQGAYTYATAWKFIKPIAKYVSFYKNKLLVVKGVETFDDRYGKCVF